MKDDNVYLLNNIKDYFQDKLLGKLLYDERKDDNY